MSTWFLDSEMSTFSEYFNQSDVDRLSTNTEKKDYAAVNIFHSNDWPSDVTIGTSRPVVLRTNVHEV